MHDLNILKLLPPPNLRGEDEHRYLAATLHALTGTTVRFTDTEQRTPMGRAIYRLDTIAGEPEFLAYYAETHPQPHPYPTKLALDLLLAANFWKAGRTAAPALIPLLARNPIIRAEPDPLLLAVLVGTIALTAFLIWRNSYDRAGIDHRRIETKIEKERARNADPIRPADTPDRPDR